MSGVDAGSGVGLFGGGSIPVIESVLSFANQRHALLLNNVANVDTPGYRAKDLPEKDFQKALEGAIAGRRSSAEPLEFVPVASGSGVTRNDGNDVAVDQEMAKLLKNAMTAQVFNRLLAAKFQMLGLSIRGRV